MQQRNHIQAVQEWEKKAELERHQLDVEQKAFREEQEVFLTKKNAYQLDLARLQTEKLKLEGKLKEIQIATEIFGKEEKMLQEVIARAAEAFHSTQSEAVSQPVLKKSNTIEDFDVEIQARIQKAMETMYQHKFKIDPSIKNQQNSFWEEPVSVNNPTSAIDSSVSRTANNKKTWSHSEMKDLMNIQERLDFHLLGHHKV
jgi:hypothetical protein